MKYKQKGLFKKFSRILKIAAKMVFGDRPLKEATDMAIEKIEEVRLLLASEEVGVIDEKNRNMIGETISTHSLIVWLAPWPAQTDKAIREFALGILKDRKGIDVTRAIIAAAKGDKEPSIRESALKVLEKRFADENFEGDERSAITETIIKISQTDPHLIVRKTGVEIISKRGGENSTKALMEILRKERDPAVSETAAKALAKSFAQYDKIFLIGEAKRGNCDKVKLLAIREMGNRKCPDITEALVEIALKDPAPEIREAAFNIFKGREDGKEIIKEQLALHLPDWIQTKQSGAVKT